MAEMRNMIPNLGLGPNQAASAAAQTGIKRSATLHRDLLIQKADQISDASNQIDEQHLILAVKPKRTCCVFN